MMSALNLVQVTVTLSFEGQGHDDILVPSHLQSIVDGLSSDLTVEQKAELTSLLVEFQDIFCRSGWKVRKNAFSRAYD